MSKPPNLCEQVFNDLMHNPAFEFPIGSDGRNYLLQQIIEITAMGLSGRNDLVESDPVKLHASIVEAMTKAVSSSGSSVARTLDVASVKTVATLLANHVMAKAYVVNEGYPQ